MLKPKGAVRRFDVFAEYSRQEAIQDGMKPDEAKGYGIWLAKVVAARRYGRASSSHTGHNHKPTSPQESLRRGEPQTPRDGKWRALDGVPQTDALFEKEVVHRMGDEFYHQVMVPSIKAAIDAGESYVSIRDKIRKDWKPS